MTMLSMVQHFCRRTNQPVPATVYGSSDEGVLQMMALLEEEGNELSSRGDWQAMVRETTHITVATESQGAITTIASSGGFRYIKNQTIWDRTNALPIYVIDGPEWQSNKARSLNGPRYSARIRGGNLIVNPVPTAGYTWAFEYVSTHWILDNDGSTYKQFFTEDTDTVLLQEPLLIAGLRWRWKKEKGYEYAEDFRSYELMVKDALSREGIKGTLSMGNVPNNQGPLIGIPEGNWIP